MPNVLNVYISLPSLRPAVERVVERSKDRVSKYGSGINANTRRTIDCPNIPADQWIDLLFAARKAG